jgi:cell division protein FtsI/penicillin-binding protein 2
VNTDSIRVEDRTITNATKGRTGTITFQTAMQWSLNTGFVTLAQRLGDGTEITQGARETMYDYFYNKLYSGVLTYTPFNVENLKEVVFKPKFSRNARVIGDHNIMVRGKEFTVEPFGSWFVKHHLPDFFNEAKIP